MKTAKLNLDNYRFADEKEWRYVPDIKTTNVLPFVPISRIRTKSDKARYNNSISHLRLDFKPNDIKYIIIKDDSEILTIVNHLKMLKGDFLLMKLHNCKLEL